MHCGVSVPQNDRGKALKAMEATWNNMEKKEKLMWIKKAAEDQKRYEVSLCPVLSLSTSLNQHCPSPDPPSLSPVAQRELSEMRAPPCSTNSTKKMKFQGEPKKPPM